MWVLVWWTFKEMHPQKAFKKNSRFIFFSSKRNKWRRYTRRIHWVQWMCPLPLIFSTLHIGPFVLNNNSFINIDPLFHGLEKVISFLIIHNFSRYFHLKKYCCSFWDVCGIAGCQSNLLSIRIFRKVRKTQHRGTLSLVQKPGEIPKQNLQKKVH